MVILYETFWGATKLFFKMTESFFIFTTHVWGFWFLHILTNTCHFLLIFRNFIIAILVCVLWYIYFPNIFMFLLDILYLLWRNIYLSTLPILNWVVCLLLLSWKSSLYILDNRLLSDIWFTNISSHSVSCLFTFLVMSFNAQFFFSLVPKLQQFNNKCFLTLTPSHNAQFLILMKFSLFNFCCHCSCFWCHIWESAAKSKVINLSICFLPWGLWF